MILGELFAHMHIWAYVHMYVCTCATDLVWLIRSWQAKFYLSHIRLWSVRRLSVPIYFDDQYKYQDIEITYTHTHTCVGKFIWPRMLKNMLQLTIRNTEFLNKTYLSFDYLLWRMRNPLCVWDAKLVPALWINFF